MENMGLEKMNNVILEDLQVIGQEIRRQAPLLEGKTLLVAGGGGFLGGYFLDVVSFLNENILKEKCRLICLDNFISGKKERVAHLVSKDYFEFINHNLVLPFSCQEPVDFIVHAASIASPAFYRKYPLETIEVNTLGTLHLLKLAKEKNVKSFLYLSSSEIYGDPPAEHIPTPETYWGNVSSVGPRACYDESKRLAETLSMVFFREYGLPVKIARPFNVYGPGLRLDDKRVIPDFLSNALKNETITMYSDGTDTRSFCYVSDAITGFFKILLSDFNGETFNVGSDVREISISDLAQVISGLFNNKIKVVHKSNPDSDYLVDNPHRRFPDLTKIRTLLNYKPNVDLQEGLRRLIQWYKL